MELACSLLIPPRLFLALWTRSVFLVKGQKNKSSGDLVFQAWLALRVVRLQRGCGPSFAALF